MTPTAVREAQARRYDVAAALLGTSRAEAIAHIKNLPDARRQELRSFVDWVIEYENNEVHAPWRDHETSSQPC